VTTSAPPLVALQHVSKTFSNGVTALAGLNLQIAAGEFISLLGPSGCGKSTALRIIAGRIRPTGGTVTWPDASTQDHRREIGFVFQDPTLMPWTDVARNVGLPLRLRGVPRREERDRIAESLALVGLDAFGKAYPRELSGGMRMSVKPRLLLMDEPFGALDEITRFKLNDDLLKLQRELGCTIVFVTHSVYESVYLSSRIAIMSPRPGQLITEIPTDAPRERDMNFRTSLRYAELCRQVSRIMIDLTSDKAS
jgi:NitT/TauT family transport system ATP-binding protein